MGFFIVLTVLNGAVVRSLSLLALQLSAKDKSPTVPGGNVLY